MLALHRLGRRRQPLSYMRERERDLKRRRKREREERRGGRER